MLQDCLDIFEEKYREKGERLILDNYELKAGTYRIIVIDGENFDIRQTIDIEKPKRGEERVINNAQSDLHNELKFYDYYSKYLNSNKAVVTGEGKIIQSANYMAFAVKKNSIADGDKLKRVTKKYYDILRYPLKKYKKDKTAEIYRDFEEKNGKPDKTLINLIENYILSGKAWEDIDYEKKDFLKIFFVLTDKEETYALYRKEAARYLAPNLYNNNDYNLTIGDRIIGLPDNNMGMNAKKPYLVNRTRKVMAPYLLDQERAGLQNLFFDYLYGGVAKGKPNVYLKSDEDWGGDIIFTSDSEDPGAITSGYYLRLSVGTGGAEIVDCDTVTNYTSYIKPAFVLKNFVSDEKELEKSSLPYDQDVNTLWKLRNLVDNLLFNGNLKNNFFTDAKDMKMDGVMKRCILESREALHSWFYLGQSGNADVVLRKVSWELVKRALSEDKIFEARRKGNLRWSLADYFNEDERMWESMSDVREKLRQHINSKEDWQFEDGKELSYAIGQAVAYLLSKSKASKKPASTINPFLNSNDLKHMKNLIRRMYIKYNYLIEASGNRRENQLFSHIAAADADEYAIDQDMIFAGFAGKQLIYESNEEGGKENE